MELELGLAPPNTTRRLVVGHLDEPSGTAGSASACRGKRCFGEAFEEEKEKTPAATTLPLFDDGSSSSSGKRKKPLVGWPPVSSARRACGGANHVKVKKEGVAIGRKVDMSLHGSYDELLATLGGMFPAATNTQDEKDMKSDDLGCRRTANHVVTYEDGDGDWMLVGDVPWDDFARSVKRLKILL